MMARGKKYPAEQIVNLLRQIEVGVAKREDVPQACEGSEDRRADILPDGVTNTAG
jgi:hypothetical protein